MNILLCLFVVLSALEVNASVVGAGDFEEMMQRASRVCMSEELDDVVAVPELYFAEAHAELFKFCEKYFGYLCEKKVIGSEAYSAWNIIKLNENHTASTLIPKSVMHP